MSMSYVPLYANLILLNTDQNGNGFSAVYFVLNARYDEDHICDGNNTGHVGDWDNCLHNYVHTVFGTLAGGDSKTLDGEQWGGVTLK